MERRRMTLEEYIYLIGRLCNSTVEDWEDARELFKEAVDKFGVKDTAELARRCGHVMACGMTKADARKSGYPV
jgi:division protein CdvB (Snf7/Vps24/ESCRT-III family)